MVAISVRVLVTPASFGEVTEEPIKMLEKAFFKAKHPFKLFELKEKFNTYS